jgi:hypothetical protein
MAHHLNRSLFFNINLYFQLESCSIYSFAVKLTTILYSTRSVKCTYYTIHSTIRWTFICKLLPIDITNDYLHDSFLCFFILSTSSYSSTDIVAECIHPNVVDRGCLLDWRSVSGHSTGFIDYTSFLANVVLLLGLPKFPRNLIPNY